MEDSGVVRWRSKQFVRAGFSDVSASLLATSEADVKEVLDALERGCPLDLALQIFV